MGVCGRKWVLWGLVFGLCLDLSFEHEGCPFSGASTAHHGHDEDHHHHHHHRSERNSVGSKLPEELAEEEDLLLYGFDSLHGHSHEHDHNHDHDHYHHEHVDLSGFGLWMNALGCSFLVSMASLVCLIILPVIFVQGKPSKAFVDSLALFGAGTMLGDAFLHQLPHAFGGEHSHSHDHHDMDLSDHDHIGHEHSHAHSLKDLSVGISVLAGIVLFLLVEKAVRYIEASGGASHGHHHHHRKTSKKLKDDTDDDVKSQSSNRKGGKAPQMSPEGKLLDGTSLQKRKAVDAKVDKPDEDAANGSINNVKSLKEAEPAQSPSNLVFGYLNLFSDGVHNFTDGMALGSAFLLYGSVGGWSRTLFLLAHELPQEIGDFGILVRSGFSIPKALFFNFLSALVALGGTVVALLLGQDPGHSSLIEGFTAGGFIYIAVAGVLAEMNNSGSVAIRSTIIQLISLILGMGVALCISLLE